MEDPDTPGLIAEAIDGLTAALRRVTAEIGADGAVSLEIAVALVLVIAVLVGWLLHGFWTALGPRHSTLIARAEAAEAEARGWRAEAARLHRLLEGDGQDHAAPAPATAMERDAGDGSDRGPGVNDGGGSDWVADEVPDGSPDRVPHRVPHGVPPGVPPGAPPGVPPGVPDRAMVGEDPSPGALAVPSPGIPHPTHGDAADAILPPPDGNKAKDGHDKPASFG